MAVTVRKTPAGARHELDRLVALSNIRWLQGYPNIGNGTSNGRLKTAAAAAYRVGGAVYSLGATDPAWDLHSETATASGAYRAYWLYVDSAGTCTFAAGTDETSAAKALASLPDPTLTKCVFGVYVAGPSTNFANALAAQGTIYNGVPDGAGWIPAAGLDASGNRVGGLADAITLVAP